jgi:hypothetical protein
MYRTVNITDCNFNKRDYACIVFETFEEKEIVIDFLSKHDEFEHNYFIHGALIVGDLNDFQYDAIYVGKYEPDLEAIENFCNNSNIKFVVYNKTRDVYFTNTEVDEKYDLYETLQEFYNQVTSIRGVDIEDVYCVDICKKVRTVLEQYKK